MNRPPIVYAIQYIHMCADATDILYLVFVFFLCIRRAAAANTVMFIVLSYTSVSYVADAAIYLYHYCVYVFVYAVYYMWPMPRYTCMVCLLYVPLSPWLHCVLGE